MLDAKETCKIKSGFHLDEDTVVVSRRMPDGRWEAWIEKENAVLIAPNGEPAPNLLRQHSISSAMQGVELVSGAGFRGVKRFM